LLTKLYPLSESGKSRTLAQTIVPKVERKKHVFSSYENQKTRAYSISNNFNNKWTTFYAILKLATCLERRCITCTRLSQKFLCRFLSGLSWNL